MAGKSAKVDDRGIPARRRALANALLREQRSHSTYQEIGQFIYHFSQAEFTLRWILSTLLRLPNDAFDVVGSSMDFAKLLSVVEALLRARLSDANVSDIAGVFRKLRSLNDVRVQIAHGTWTEGIDGLTVRAVGRQKFVVAFEFDQPGQLSKAVDRAIDLHSNLVRAFMALPKAAFEDSEASSSPLANNPLDP